MDEKRLWLGVLLQAIKDVAGNDICVSPKQRALIEHKARAWFYSTRYDSGSYLWICDTLGLSPDYLRRRLFAMVTRHDWNERRRRVVRVGAASRVQHEVAAVR